MNNYQFDTQDWKSLPLGAISALQYDNQTFGSCFYATVSLLDFVDIFQKDIENLLTEYDFYGLLVYDPIHFLDAYFVVYEKCTLSQLLDKAAQFANLDPGYISETMVRIVTTSITDLPQMLADISYFTSLKDGGDLSNLNYYQAGSSIGRLFKKLMDFTLRN